MQYELNGIYHIYNRGINKKNIFYGRKNYLFFLRKMEYMLAPSCTMLAWCLMPNHFHILACATEVSIKRTKHPMPIQRLSASIQSLLSSYTKAINKQENFCGNLFQQGTKKKCTLILDERESVGSSALYCPYAKNVFHYIHHNPVAAGLVDKREDWEFSSFHNYLLWENSALCNVEYTTSILAISKKEIYSGNESD